MLCRGKRAIYTGVSVPQDLMRYDIFVLPYYSESLKRMGVADLAEHRR
jgi:hypothetical protein